MLLLGLMVAGYLLLIWLVESRAPDLPATMHTDAMRLHQILNNLLSNAFKFTDRGRIAVRLRAADSRLAGDGPAVRDACGPVR